MGFGLTDAGLYYKEGDKTAAGITGALSVLPGIGMIVKRIPGIKQLGKEGMEQLGKKVAGKETGTLTKVEKQVMDDIGKNQKMIKTELNKLAKNQKEAVAKFNPKSCVLKSLKKPKLIKENWNSLLENCNIGQSAFKFAGSQPQLFKLMSNEIKKGTLESSKKIEKLLRKKIKELEKTGKTKISKNSKKEILDEVDDLQKQLKKDYSNNTRSWDDFTESPLGEEMVQFNRQIEGFKKSVDKEGMTPDLIKRFNGVRNKFDDVAGERLHKWDELLDNVQRISTNY
jgi:gas vesicle protein